MTCVATSSEGGFPQAAGVTVGKPGLRITALSPGVEAEALSNVSAAVEQDTGRSLVTLERVSFRDGLFDQVFGRQCEDLCQDPAYIRLPIRSLALSPVLDR